MSLNNISTELIFEILDYLILQEQELAGYATISTTWQRAIEQHTFARLSFTSEDLASFEQFVALSPQHTHRRAAIKHIGFTVVLPTYSEKACARYERDADKSANNEALTTSFTRLFVALKACEDTKDIQPFSLEVLDFYSPTDIRSKGQENQTTDWKAFWMEQQKDLGKRRWAYSDLCLLRPDDLPLLNRVACLAVKSHRRRLEPASAALLTSKLPLLRSVSWELTEGKYNSPKVRVELRKRFAETLQSLSLPGLEELSLGLPSPLPSDEDFQNADVRGTSDGDCLSSSLRTFITTHQLKVVTLHSSTCIDAQFFRSAHSRATQTWPHLEYLNVKISMVRPDGGWYFRRDPIAPAGDSDDESDDSLSNDSEFESIPESGSDYDSDDSFFASDGEHPDTFDERKEMWRTGCLKDNRFRTWPTDELETLLEAAAQSAACMPKLKSMQVELSFGASPRTRCHPMFFEFSYAAPSVESPSHQRMGNIDRARLLWGAAPNWKMSERLGQLWENVLGVEGIVQYEQFLEGGVSGLRPPID